MWDLLTRHDIGIMASGLKCLAVVEIQVLSLIGAREKMAAVVLRRQRQYLLWNQQAAWMAHAGSHLVCSRLGLHKHFHLKKNF